MRAYQDAAVAAMQPYDGYVAQYLGDGIMVYFGWPTAHEDAAQRAVYADLAIVEAMTPLNETQLVPQYGVRAHLRLGLHTGEVYNWFTEGSDTVDLQEAKALLDALT